MYVNGKRDLLKLLQEWRKEGIKENYRGECKHDIFDTLKIFCKCHNVPPQHNNKKFSLCVCVNAYAHKKGRHISNCGPRYGLNSVPKFIWKIFYPQWSCILSFQKVIAVQ
jgi:hypothetical protein